MYGKRQESGGAHWNHAFDRHLNCPGPVFCFSPSILSPPGMHYCGWPQWTLPWCNILCLLIRQVTIFIHKTKVLFCLIFNEFKSVSLLWLLDFASQLERPSLPSKVTKIFCFCLVFLEIVFNPTGIYFGDWYLCGRVSSYFFLMDDLFPQHIFLNSPFFSLLMTNAKFSQKQEFDLGLIFLFNRSFC